MKLTDMKRTKQDKEAERKSWDEVDSMEDYSYGLQLRLDDATVKKMQLGDLDAEEEVALYAKAFVAEDVARKVNGKTVRAVSLQVTHLALVLGESNEDAAEAMYGDKKKD